MAFSYEKLMAAHKASKAKSIDFAHAIFGPESKLGPEYFKTKDSISTAHLEKICALYNLPMEYFFNDIPLDVYRARRGAAMPDERTLKSTLERLEEGYSDLSMQVAKLTNLLTALTESASLGKGAKSRTEVGQ